MNKHKTLLLLTLTGLLTLTSPVISANAAWATTSAGKIYTQSASPGYVTGWKKIGKYWYYFNSKGIMQTGFQTIDKCKYYFNSKGVRMSGWINSNGKRYYALSNGKLVMNQWYKNYYFYSDGSLATNTWINGKWVGANGKYTGIQKNIGWITKSGKTYYYDENSNLVKGWVNVDGKTYYTNPSTGVLVTGWFKAGGKTYYAAKTQNGAIHKNKWFKNRYLGSDGAALIGWHTLSDKTYYFSSTGIRQTGWVKIENKYYYFNSKGVLQKNTFIDNMYVGADGARMTGMITVGKYTYYMSPSTGKKSTGFVNYNGKRYYFNKSGILQKNKWLSSKTYYAGSTGALLTGLNTIGSNTYYFNKKTCKKMTNTFLKIGSDTYFLKKDGTAAKNIWVKSNNKFYYFKSTGKMAVSTWVGKYYVDATGARTNTVITVGWKTVNNSKYYFNSNGVMVTGLQKIDGSTYYFDQNGIMQTGIQSVGNSKYYFYTDGKMAVSTSIIVGTKQYTIGAKGIVTAEKSIKIEDTGKGSEIVNYALQFVGNPYVYGGNSLTNGVDCSGFTKLILEHFGYKLLRVANDQMYGPSSAYIKQGYTPAVTVELSSIQPGDLLFYGSGNYASHVAIYMGNGQIVHASNSQPYPKGGIKISNYDYNTPLKAVRYWS